MPSTDGPARGLRNTVCISRPLTASPAPAIMDVSACGRRDFSTIFRHISDSSALPERIAITERAGMLTDPNSRLSTRKMMIDSSIATIRIILVRRLI